MGVNFIAIIVCAVLTMIVGAIWYGPLFGKKWMEICGVNPGDTEAIKKMQKAAMPLYGVQFALALLQVYILAGLLSYTNAADRSPVFAVFMWLGFIMPTIAGSSMWTNEATKLKWARFLVQSGYQLVMFITFGFVLGMWR